MKNPNCPRLNTEEAAEYLNVSARSLRRWRNSDPPQGPAYERHGRLVLYPTEFLDEWIDDGVTVPKKH